MIRPRYDPETGKFKGLYETFGYLVVRRSCEEMLFNYGYDREKSKRRITLQKENFKLFFESRKAERKFSNIYFFSHP